MELTLKKAKDLIEKGEDFVIAKVTDTQGSAPRKKGAWLLMEKGGACYGTVGGGLVEAETIKKMKQIFETKSGETQSFLLNREHQSGLDMRCGGEVVVRFEYIKAADADGFVDEFKEKSKALIFGAGHVGLALEPILRHIGFETVVIDDRSEFANSERFPFADVKLIKGFDDAFEGVETDEDSYIVIITRGHVADHKVLRQSMKRPNAYIGMIGSKKKVTETLKILVEEEGFPQEQVDQVYSPIGIKIAAETPEEIAISIAAEIINVRAGHGK